MSSLPVDLDANSHYNVLGVSESDSTADIRDETKVYLNKLHPDNMHYDITNDEYQKVKDAVTVLTDEEKREEYDSNKTQLTAEVPSHSLPVCVGEEVTIQIQTETGNTTQYDVEISGETYKTDGNGELPIQFSSEGEKQLIFDKRDRGTNRYLPDSIIIPVTTTNEVEMDMELRRTNGNEIQKNAKAGERIHVTVLDAQTGDTIPYATVKYGLQTAKTGANGETTITITGENTAKITCTKTPENKTVFKKQTRELRVIKQRKQLAIDIEYDELYKGDVLEFHTVTEDGGTEPFVTVTIEANGSTQTFESDKNGLFQTPLTNTGTIHIELSKETTDNAVYSSCHSSIFVKNENQLNITVDTETKDNKTTVKTYVNLMLDSNSNEGDITIELIDPTKYANGKTIETAEKYIQNSTRAIFEIEENGVYKIKITGDNYKTTQKEIHVTSIKNTSKTTTKNHRKNITATITYPIQALKYAALPLTALPTPITGHMPESKAARTGVIFLWVFAIATGVSTIATTGSLQPWITLTGVMYALPMLYPRIGAWCYGIFIPQIPQLNTFTTQYEPFTYPSGTGAELILVPFTISIIHYIAVKMT